MNEKGKKVRKVVVTAGAVFVILVALSTLLTLKYANRVLKMELERRLGRAFSIEKIKLNWDNVEVKGITLRNVEGKVVASVDTLSARADFMKLFRKEYIISNVTLKKPYMFVEVGREGAILNPVLPVESDSAGQAREEGTSGGKETLAAPIVIKKLEISGGSIDYLDGKSPHAPVLTKLNNIDLIVEDLALPFADTFSPYLLSARCPGNGSTGIIKSSGKVKPGTMDMDAGGEVIGLDITGFKPYFQKQGDVDIVKGIVDIDVTMKVTSGKIRAPGRTVLRDLEFRSRHGNQFMGVPLTMVAAFLKQNGGRIPVNFIVEDDLYNPRMNLSENFTNRLMEGFADKLGFSIKGMGQSMVTAGAEGAKGIGSGLKNVGKGLERLFSK